MFEHDAKQLANRVIFLNSVDGAAGFAAAQGIAPAGATIVGNTWSDETAQRIAEVVESVGGRYVRARLNLLDSHEMEEGVRKIAAEQGRLDGVACLANWHRGPEGEFYVPFEEIDDQLWSHMIGRNLDSVFFTLRPAVSVMRQQGHGKVVVFISHAGIEGVGHSAYAAAHGARMALVRTLGKELASQNIQVNGVIVGAHEGFRPMTPEEIAVERAETPAGRLGTLEELGMAFRFLLGPGSGFMCGDFINRTGRRWLS